MIEVFQIGGRWAWTMISSAGRLLAQRDDFPCQTSAIEDARRYRAAFFRTAAGLDARQAVAI